ncbi:PREDICTED: proline-rich protein 18 [Lipotes vexillifer]|uniref:Proline-rich protein 18 n=1 Tax=Lipotes vexillifer TaxID=118797 RepID=A0A340WG36_LIPVE|nr:PREDICTED: proline-rich protein 18 [Lipotes vexillifer]
MPFPPLPPPPPTPAPGVPAARPPPRKPGAPRKAAVPEKRRPPERPPVLLSSSWPSATLKRPPARRAPGPASPRAPPPSAPGRPRAPAPCAPRPAGSSDGPAAVATSGAGPDAALRFSLSLTPEAVLVIQRRHLEKQLLARPRRAAPAPSADAGRPLAPWPRGRAAGLGRRPPLPGTPLLPGGLQGPDPGPRPADLRPLLKVSLLNERHKYDDVEYEEEVAAADEGLVRKCTEWLRGVESAAAARDRGPTRDAARLADPAAYLPRGRTAADLFLPHAGACESAFCTCGPLPRPQVSSGLVRVGPGDPPRGAGPPLWVSLCECATPGALVRAVGDSHVWVRQQDQLRGSSGPSSLRRQLSGAFAPAEGDLAAAWPAGTTVGDSGRLRGATTAAALLRSETHMEPPQVGGSGCSAGCEDTAAFSPSADVENES